MTLWAAIFWSFAVICGVAAIGMAWILVAVRMRPRDLADEDERCSDWDGRF